MTEQSSQNNSSRRDFIKTSAVIGGATLASGMINGAYAAGSDVIRVGLVGCGNRGTGAAEQALRADPQVKLVTMGDAFADRLEDCLSFLQGKKNLDKRIDVPKERQFVGFDAYKKVIESDIDVVLLASPPHFRPMQIKAAVEAGKHIFAEKPVAVDAPGCRSVLEACEKAKEKKLSIVSGLCWRYHRGKQETMKRVHDGGVGEIVTLQCTYNTGGLWVKRREKGWSDMEWQLRNWLYFAWLSGDHNVEQHIHSLDKMAWAMKDEYPVKAFGVGGRQARISPAYGHIYDHHAVTYEFKNGVKLFSMCRQWDKCAKDVTDHIMGTKGTCDVMRHRIKGEKKWRHVYKPGEVDDMYQNEHNELFKAIRKGEPINNGEYMTKSTLMAIMGRMATYTGEVIEWDQAKSSTEVLAPKQYVWGELATPAIPRPGLTKFS